MAGSIVQFVEASGATAATSLGVSFTGTTGNQYYVVACSDDATTTYADTLGNTITERTSVIEAAIPRRMHLATGTITTGGATTVTVTFGASVANRQLIVVEVAGTGAYDASGSQTDTGNNPTTAATATNSAQPAFGVAVCLDYQGGTPTVGTGYTSGGVITGGGLLAGRIEYSSPSYTTVASQSANFGNAGFSRTCTVFGIFLEGAPPVITAQPTDQTANTGATATFSVTATGATSYQWQDDSGGSFADISGATSSSYAASSVTYSMQGRQYRCNVTNISGTTTSSSATLRVAFNLTGTGPRSAPLFGGGPFGAGEFGTVSNGVAASGGSHATSGALTGQSATVAGSATHLTLHATSGALAAQAATIAGTAQHRHAATGALTGQAATVAGTAAHLTLHTSSGALTGQAATVAGTAAAQFATTGALTAQAATIAGAADHTTAGASHSTSGALASDAATVAGSATHLTLHTTSGALAAQAATVAGVAAHQHAATGSLTGQAATVAGTAAHLTLHTSTGALVAQSATASGAAAHEHAASGALAAQAATISGTAVHSAAGAHATSGALVSGEAQIGGTADHISNTPTPTPAGGWDDDPKPRKKKLLVEIDGKTYQVTAQQLRQLEREWAEEAAEKAIAEARAATTPKASIPKPKPPRIVNVEADVKAEADRAYKAAYDEAVRRAAEEEEDDITMILLHL